MTPALLPLAAILTSAQGAVPDAWSSSDTDQVRAVVAEMLADAETRSSLLNSTGGGHDGHFFLASPDGDFRLNLSGQVQFRYTMNFRESDGVNDDFESSFQTRRTKLRADGTLFDSFIFKVQTDFTDASGGTAVLEDAYAGYAFDNGLIIIWGQLRMPVLWEDVIKDSASLAADASVVNTVFNPGRSQGVWAHYSADSWRMWLGFDDGIRSANSDYSLTEADWAVTTRWELKFAGEWSQFDQFTSRKGSDLAAKLGGAVHWQDGPEAPGFADTELAAYTADLMLKGDGWNLYFAGVGLYTDTDGVGAFNDFGLVAQGGFRITDSFEPFARYDAVIPDSDRVGGDNSFNTVAVGFNYYFHEQAAKFTMDAQWFMDDTASNALVAGVAGAPAGRGIGLLPSGEENQVALRFQFQLLF